MSETIMTVAFGATHVNNGNPRFVRVLADLVVGGSGVFIFHTLYDDDSVVPVRIRPSGDVTRAALLMSGFALAEKDVNLPEEAAALAGRLRHGEDDIELDGHDSAVLTRAVADLEVTAIVTAIGTDPAIGPEDFEGTSWSILVARAA